MAENMLSVSPLSAEVNAFTIVAKEMREKTYPTAESAREAKINADWLDFLARRPIPANTREPLILMMLARLACDGGERERFAAVIRAVDDEIAKKKNGTSAPKGASKGASNGGFRIGNDGEVVQT